MITAEIGYLQVVPNYTRPDPSQLHNLRSTRRLRMALSSNALNVGVLRRLLNDTFSGNKGEARNKA